MLNKHETPRPSLKIDYKKKVYYYIVELKGDELRFYGDYMSKLVKEQKEEVEKLKEEKFKYLRQHFPKIMTDKMKKPEDEFEKLCKLEKKHSWGYIEGAYEESIKILEKLEKTYYAIISQ